jgi:DHA1 family bicyclomycin/chloramphenicol resistance-like MFS transporter
MLVLAAMLSLTPYSVDAFLPSFPAAAAAFGVAPSGIQASMTAYLAGVAVGQLGFGPLSDRHGRRVPLLIGVLATAAGALTAALAGDLGVLLAARAVQGLGASSCMVISRAIVRDLTRGTGTIRVLSSVTALSGAANIAAPIAGGIAGDLWGWRAPLWLIAGLACGLLVATLAAVPETLPPARRAHHARGLLTPFRDSIFARYALAQAFSTATMMAYVASSPFLYQQMLGYSARSYGLLFAANAAVAVLVNVVVNHRFRGAPPERIVSTGFAVSLLGTVCAGGSLMTGAPPVIVAVAVGVSMSTMLMNGPNIVGLALDRVPTSVGGAAAVLGFVQFATGAVVSPAVGLAGAASHVVPLIVMGSTAVAGMIAIGRPRTAS